MAFFDIQTPRDMLCKLEHHYRSIEQTPSDVYAIGDFFTTAEQTLDYIHPNNPKARAEERNTEIILQVCSHLATLYKHTEANQPRHDSVQNTVLAGAVFQRNSFQADAFQVGTPVVELKGKAAEKFGSTIQVTDFAREVLEYWRGRLQP
jgi:hypothetical protein